jgi:hypothetical protein
MIRSFQLISTIPGIVFDYIFAANNTEEDAIGVYDRNEVLIGYQRQHIVVDLSEDHRTFRNTG